MPCHMCTMGQRGRSEVANCIERPHCGPKLRGCTCAPEGSRYCSNVTVLCDNAEACLIIHQVTSATSATMLCVMHHTAVAAPSLLRSSSAHACSAQSPSSSSPCLSCPAAAAARLPLPRPCPGSLSQPWAWWACRAGGSSCSRVADLAAQHCDLSGSGG